MTAAEFKKFLSGIWPVLTPAQRFKVQLIVLIVSTWDDEARRAK